MLIKKGNICNSVDKALLLSDTLHHTDNLNSVFKILITNYYPMDVIVKFINLRMNKIYNNNKKLLSVKNQLPTVYLF